MALILVSLLTISCVSAAEDGNDVLNTISVDGIGDEQVVEASVDDVGLGAAEENNILQYTPEDFNVTFYADEFEVNYHDNDKVFRINWPEDCPDYYSVIAKVEGGMDSTPQYHDNGVTFTDVVFGDLVILDTGVYNITVWYNYELLLATHTITVTNPLYPTYFVDISPKMFQILLMS